MITSVWWVGVVLVAQVPPPMSFAALSTELRRERQVIREREAADLDALAVRLRTEGKPAEAEAVLSRIEPPPPTAGRFRFHPLPEVVSARGKAKVGGLANVPAEKPADSGPGEAGTILARSSQSLFDLAVRAMSGTSKRYALADGCLRAVLDRDPDHAEARRLLGYVAHDGGWATPHAVRQIKLGNVLHPTYGWVRASWVEHLEQGQLPGLIAPGQKTAPWLSTAEADALRDRITRPWDIQTEHFRILADVPLSEAIAFGRKLEEFHDLFFSLLSDVIAEDLPMAVLFRDKTKSTVSTPSQHTVYYFATKDEYVEVLRLRKGPEIAETLGIYLPPAPGKKSRGAAYFYHDPGGQLDVTATLFHEVSHQLLFESTKVGPNVYKNNVGNYWVFEGLGTYFETVASAPDGSLLVGGYVGPRINVARIRLLDRGEHVPIELLVRMNESKFYNPEGIHLHYNESMALAVFLMEGRDGRYREDFLEYVRDALRGRLRGNGRELDDHLGVPYKQLDTEFLADLTLRR